MVYRCKLGNAAVKKSNPNLQTYHQVKLLCLNFRGKGDTSNYSTYPDSTEEPKALKPSEDPFSNW